MPLRDLLAAIEAEANEERSRIEAEGRARADAILAEARAGAARAREDVLRAHAPATRTEASRRVAVARLEAARIVREARERAFSLLLAEVRARLAAEREGPAHRATLRALLDEALAALPDAATVRANPRDGALVGELLGGAGEGLRVEADAGIVGGVVVESAGGRVVRNTFEERLANAEPQLRTAYGRRLDTLMASTGSSR